MYADNLINRSKELLDLRPDETAGNLSFLFLVLFAFFCPISIGAAQIFFGLSFLLVLVRLPRLFTAADKAPPFITPLAVFIALSLISIVFSIDPGASFWYSRNLLLFLVIPAAVFNVDSESRLRAVVVAVTGGALATTAWGAVRVATGTAGGESGRRLTGFLGHYMTAGGELMIIVLLLAGVVLFVRRNTERYVAVGAAAILLVGLLLTQSRNVYVGLAIAMLALLLLWRPGLVILLPFALSLGVLISPPIIRERIFSITNLDDESIQRRLKMMKVGSAIVADFSLFGAGPQQAETVYDHYKQSPEDPREVHLHNNPLQIAAERGIPTAMAWLWMMCAFAFGHFRLLSMPNAPPALRAVAAGALSAVVGMFVAGMFEYNFGDSEVLMLFLLIVSMPYGIGIKETRAQQNES